MRTATAVGVQEYSETLRYTPPENWKKVLISDLLTGSPRWNPDKQLSFLDNLTPSRTAEGFQVYVAGDVSLLKRPCVSVIGTRKVTPEGILRARRVARGLVQAGIVVVSGLADGVDTEAMTATIANGGRTIGVIGTPLDKATPSKNAALQETIYREHLLVSQFGFGTQIYKSNFPQRNRLMAFLSDATVVIEASDTSGTLHQAAECTKLGRWLFIAKSVVDDPSLTWPAKFLKYETCIVLENVRDITDRILK